MFGLDPMALETMAKAAEGAALAITRMADAQERQAVALERIAQAVMRVNVRGEDGSLVHSTDAVVVVPAADTKPAS